MPDLPVDRQMTPGVSIIIPVYSSGGQLEELLDRIQAALIHTDYEVVLVDDCGTPESWPRIRQIALASSRVRGFRLGRNFGQHNAVLAGVRAARFPVCVTLDDDLQNPPEEIPKLLSALTGEIDVVYGAPSRTAQKSWRRISSLTARKLISSTLSGPSATDMSSFRAFRTELREAFVDEIGPFVSIDALLAWSTSRFEVVRVRHDRRTSGRSGYSFLKLLSFALDTATNFSARPLQAATSAGLASAIIGVVLLVYVIGRVIFFGIEVPGFAFLASAVVFFAGIQLFALGIVGEYVARIHFRAMKKPSYYIRERTDGHATTRLAGEVDR